MTVNVVFHVLVTLAAVIALGYLLGRACTALGQPAVLGEIVAGILLGPSFLGAISPAAMHLMIPPAEVDVHEQVPTALKAISQLGIIFYMFLVGLRLNAASLKKTAKTAVAVTIARFALPFAFGVPLAYWLFPIVGSADISFVNFTLFFCTALSVTAFPVLARILAEQKLDQTPLGILALGCAAADDLIAWCMLAFIVGISQSNVSGAAVTVILAVGFIVILTVVVRPFVQRLAHAVDTVTGPLPAFAIPLVLVLVLLSALATEWIGIHAVFGAFLLGVILPHEGRLVTEISRRLEDVVSILLLPAFFALTGLRTEIGLISGWQNGLICLAIIITATLGTCGGAILAGKLTGLNWRESATLGVMMNTRGLMALIVLEIGRRSGIISPTLYAMMVLMALATTIATAPCLKWLKHNPNPNS
ncbi:MAG: cation:proton antiporter [Gemmataceae bacterium]